MAFSKQQMLIAKTIRQNEAKERNCKVKEVKWNECVKLSFDKTSEAYIKATKTIEAKKDQFVFGCIDMLGLSSFYMWASEEDFKSDVDGIEITVQQVEELLGYCRTNEMANIVLDRNYFGVDGEPTPEGRFIDDEYFCFLGEMLHLVVNKGIGLKSINETEAQTWKIIA